MKTLLTELRQLERNAGRDDLREMLRQFREELRHYEDGHGRPGDLYRDAVDSAEIGVWDWDVVTGRVSWNEHYAQILGLSDSDFEGDFATFIVGVHPDDRDALTARIEAARTNGRHLDHTYRVCRPDGAVRWVRAKGGSYCDAAGRAIRMTGTAVDVTEQVQGRQLAESECRYRTLVENADTIIARFDRQLRHVFVNGVVEKATGMKPEHLLGKTNRELGMPAALCAVWEAQLRKAFETGAVELAEFTFDTPTGRRWYQSRLAPERGEDGTISTVMTICFDVTRLKEAMAAANESQERLKLVTEATGYGTFDICPQTWNMIWSNKNRENFGIAQGTPVTVELVLKALHPADRERVDQAVHEALRPGGSGTYQAEYRTIGIVDGKERWLKSNAQVYFDETGRPVRMVGGTVNITERKRAEELLRTSEEKFRGLMESAPDAMVIVDSNGTIVLTNAQTERLFGYAREEVLGARVEMLMPERFRGGHGGQREGYVTAPRARAMGNSHTLLGMRKDGTEFPIEVSLSPLPAGDGKLVSSAIRDITKRMQNEEALRRSEARLAAALEGGRMGLWEWDVRSKTSVWNATEYELLGLPVGDGNVTMQLFFGRVHPEDAAGLDRALAEVMKSGSEFYHEHRIVRADTGEVRWLVGAGRLTRDAAGEPLKMIGVNYDITERRTAAEALEESNKAKDRFLAVLSHELRTPLTPVLAATELLKGEDLPAADRRELVRMIHRNVELEARLIDDLLDLTRITHNKLQLRTGTVDVHEKIKYVMDMCAADVAAKMLTLTTALGAADHHVDADAARFQQIVWNLVKNAIKFTPAEGRIWISTENNAAGEVLIVVRDNGIGIDPAALERIFKAFEQGGADITRRFGGLGLGLAISKALVEMHGGSIGVASAGSGKGATFTVRLPAARKTTSPGRRAAPRGDIRLDCSVLLVEDHPDTRRSMAKVLATLGCRVKTAGTVDEALRAVAHDAFDLLISDIGLPDGTGRDLMRHVKREHGLRGIALSGYGMDEDVAKSSEAGFEAHLTKPVHIALLEETLRRLTVGEKRE